MKFNLVIMCVNGDVRTLTTESPIIALKTLEHEDHEGANVDLTTVGDRYTYSYTNGEVYHYLETVCQVYRDA